MTELLGERLHRVRPSLVAEAVRRSHRAALALTVEALESAPLILGRHHPVLCRVIDEVFAGDRTRLLINIPPGFSKTLTAVWTLVARGFQINPRSRFLHTSYSADLALDNSARIKEVLESETWQRIGAPALRADANAKGLWKTDEGGSFRAAAAGSGITGFRAGQMTRETDADGRPLFSGAIIVDDPVKPDDIRSRRRTAEQNRRYNNTVASRLAREDVPIIVVMQRLGTFASASNDLAECGDLSEYLLRGGSGETWDHLMLPAEIDAGAEYPSVWTHGRPIEHGLADGPLWPEKLDEEAIARWKRASPHVYAAQLDQRPKVRAGDPMIDGDWLGRYVELPVLKKIELFADTANKTGERNDYTAVLAAGLGVDGYLYLLDLLHGKWTSPDLHPKVEAFWQRWRAQGATRISVEDAQSGTALIQSLAKTLGQSVRGVPRTKDKFTRVNGVLERLSSGLVRIPVSAPWVAEFVAELEDFTDDDSHLHDDRVDVLVDAIETLLPIKGAAPTPRPLAGMHG